VSVNLARISIILGDDSGVTASLPHYLTIDDAQTHAQSIAEAQTLASLVDALTGAYILNVLAGDYVGDPGGWKSGPVAGYRLAAAAVFQFGCVAGTCKWGIAIPAFLRSKMTGNHVNTSDPDVVAYVNHITANTGPYRYSTIGGVLLNSLSSTFRSTRTHSHASSRESSSVIA
jgi:hypothetical protein